MRHHAILETPRLILRMPEPSDAEAVFVWVSDPEVNRFMPYNLYETVEQARAWLETLPAQEDSYPFAFVRKQDGRVIGSGDIGPGDDDRWHLGYNLRRDVWNQGYATEAARAMIRFAHDTFGVRRFAASYAVDNPASGRVMEHCGMRYLRDSEYARFDGSETFKARVYGLEMED